MRKIFFLILLVPFFLHAQQELGRLLYAVHATDHLPEDGILYAGYGHLHEKDDIPDIRYTVHFSIGELVRPLGDDWMTWEDKLYAIVAPLESLYPQLVNLNCYDTFILGDLQLTEDMFLVAPQGTVFEANCQLFEYDSSSSLREAVDAVIASQGGWKVTMIGEDLEDEYPPALLGDENINTFEFFSFYLEQMPHLSLGLRWDPLHGEAWRFANLELLSLHFFQEPDSFDRFAEAEEHISVIRETYLDNSTLSLQSKEYLLAKIRMMEHVFALH